MEFAQHGKSILQWKVCSVALWAVYMALAVYAYLDEQVYIALFLTALAILSFLVFHFSWREEKKRIVSVDVQGISLTVAGAQVYALGWKEIEKLACVWVDHRRAVRIIGKDMAAETPDYVFELGREAAAALARYSPIPVEKETKASK